MKNKIRGKKKRFPTDRLAVFWPIRPTGNDNSHKPGLSGRTLGVGEPTLRVTCYQVRCMCHSHRGEGLWHPKACKKRIGPVDMGL